MNPQHRYLKFGRCRRKLRSTRVTAPTASRGVAAATGRQKRKPTANSGFEVEPSMKTCGC